MLVILVLHWITPPFTLIVTMVILLVIIVIIDQPARGWRACGDHHISKLAERVYQSFCDNKFVFAHFCNKNLVFADFCDNYFIFAHFRQKIVFAHFCNRNFVFTHLFNKNFVFAHLCGKTLYLHMFATKILYLHIFVEKNCICTFLQQKFCICTFLRENIFFRTFSFYIGAAMESKCWAVCEGIYYDTIYYLQWCSRMVFMLSCITCDKPARRPQAVERWEIQRCGAMHTRSNQTSQPSATFTYFLAKPAIGSESLRFSIFAPIPTSLFQLIIKNYNFCEDHKFPYGLRCKIDHYLFPSSQVFLNGGRGLPN